jgi:Response regulator containing a CheY-like receiver domain and an HTH DNA-binding domain
MKVIHFDDHTIFATSLEFAFKQSQENINFIAYVCTDVELIREIINKEKPDIILLDIHLGESSGLNVATQLLSVESDLKIIFFTGYNMVEYHNQAIKIGCKGFLDKNISMDELIKRLVYVQKGGTIFPKRERTDYIELTEREKIILLMLSAGHKQHQIAEKLNISRRTVNNHVQKTLEKLYVNSTLAAVVKAIELGIIILR